MMTTESHDSQMTLDSVMFLPSQTSEIISLSDDNKDDPEIFVSTQPSTYNSISSLQAVQVSEGSEFNWATVSQSIFVANNQMDQFLQSETSNYNPRYQTETLSDPIESYDHYFNDSFDDQLLNIIAFLQTLNNDWKTSGQGYTEIDELSIVAAYKMPDVKQKQHNMEKRLPFIWNHQRESYSGYFFRSSLVKYAHPRIRIKS
ncbi:uncharacterized protein ACN427_014062 isoform 1-T1 [Glossina fuscipes fuscipes]